MTEPRQSQPDARAREILGLASLGSTELHELKVLERALALAGNHELARAVRERRQVGDVTLAVATLSGRELRRAEMLALAKRLAEYKELGYARRITQLARRGVSKTTDAKIYTELFQKSALYTYKDPDLPAEWRLDQALDILGEGEDLTRTTDPETLGLAGAIFKRKWEVNGQRQQLERALFHYLKGYAQGAPPAARSDVVGYLRQSGAECQLDASQDRGYCGINAAFVLDLLAQEEEEEASRIGLVPAGGQARRAEARLIREEIIRSVPPLRDPPDGAWLNHEWWFYATIGEAFFGLGNFDEALTWLKEQPARAGLRVGFDQTAPAGLDVPEWEYESTARQLARLARVQGGSALSEEAFARTDAGRALRKFLAEDETAVGTAFRGKFGLGLSGGGFRASLFHIGTLASLAEHDLLRHVEVLSCVSGGSIIGAHYYLKLRQLLESRPDGDIAQGDYIRIVQEIETEFLSGVQQNIRTRVLAELFTNLKMLFWPDYSRTLRVGELYESELFESVEGEKEWYLDEIFIRPRLPDGQNQEDFRPRNHNWRRKSKVPSLVLNAACLNTGHNWQFTASYMGEPPMPINAEIDCNERMRRMYYKDAPPAHRKIRLGHAVAASSCVPGLFEPLVLDGLYPDRSVRLVDGGVCDNQGIASLLEQDCTVLLVSDGSGQMESERVPSGTVLGVPLRANGILQARVREAQYGDVSARRRSWLLRGLLFVHLKQDLPGESIAWKDCPSQLLESEFERRKGARDRTSYGVAISTQKKLAAIRTDLDSFSDAEAFALMASAYRMTSQLLGAPSTGVERTSPKQLRTQWRFLQVDRHLEPEAEKNAFLERLLQASSRTAFKVWSLSPPLIVIKWAMAIAVVAAAAFALVKWPETSLLHSGLSEWLTRYLTLRNLAWVAGLALGFGFLARVVKRALGDTGGSFVMSSIQPRESFQRVAVGAGMSLFGCLVARLHLHVFDQIYLHYGRVERFERKTS